MLSAVAPWGWLAAYGAMAAGLSLIVAMWPFVAAAADRIHRVGDPAARLGLKRAAGWFVLANLACLLASLAGRAIGWAWGWLVPLVNDPIFQLTRQGWAIVLDLLPFFAWSVVVGTMALWGLNLFPPKAERVRRSSLAWCMVGQNLLAYLLIGLLLWQGQIPDMGGYAALRTNDQVRQALAACPARIWYVAPGDSAVRSVRPNGADDRVEWAGPVPRPTRSMWLVAPPTGGSRLVFVAADRLTLVDLPGGKVTVYPAATPPEMPPAGKQPGQEPPVSPTRPPATPAELAAVLNVPEKWICPAGPCRPTVLDETEVSPAAARQAEQLNVANQAQWIRLRGRGRPMPAVPIRKAWQTQMELQSLGGRWIVANFGDRLMLLNAEEGWIGPLDLAAEAYVVTPGN